MKAVCAAMLCVTLVAFAGTARAQDENAKKILGAWVLEKAGSDLPAGTVVDFAKDLKLTVTVKDDGKDMKLDGTYKIEKDKLTVKLKLGETTIEETVTIKKITDDVLELEDKDKKVDVFKRPKK